MTNETAKIAEGLSDAQRAELLLVKDSDQGGLARGDLSGLSGIRLATLPSTCGGFYALTPLGLAVRKHLQDNQND